MTGMDGMTEIKGITDIKHERPCLLAFIRLCVFVSISFLVAILTTPPTPIPVPAIISTAQADDSKKCFVDPKQAYQYLLSQEKKQAPAFGVVEKPASFKSARMSSNSTKPKYSKVNINTATEAELVTLAGIGSKKAQAILLYRNTMGQFSTVDDLTKVHGIGEKTVEKNRAVLSVDD